MPVYFYDPLENKEVFFYTPADNKPVYLYNEADFQSNCDFTVFIPIELKPNNLSERTKFLDRINAQVDYYKLYSKRHRLAWF